MLHSAGESEILDSPNHVLGKNQSGWVNMPTTLGASAGSWRDQSQHDFFFWTLAQRHHLCGLVCTTWKIEPKATSTPVVVTQLNSCPYRTWAANLSLVKTLPAC